MFTLKQVSEGWVDIDRPKEIQKLRSTFRWLENRYDDVNEYSLIFMMTPDIAPVDRALNVLKDEFGFDFGHTHEGEVLNALEGIAAFFYLAGRRGASEAREHRSGARKQGGGLSVVTSWWKRKKG